MRTAWWVVFGVVTHVIFAVTVWRLFRFLADTTCLASVSASLPRAMAIDALLALQFAVPHSLLLLPAMRKRLEALIPSPQYGCFFCVATCVSLWLVFSGWQSIPAPVWEAPRSVRPWIQGAFLATWGALFYSLSLTGLGYQTGFTPWWHWLRGKPIPRRGFEPRGAYRFLRHPVYLSFAGLLWITPTMTTDRAVLTAIWSGYILVGSCLKDRRLVHYLGDRYREYQARVVGYPGMLAGPLARVPNLGARLVKGPTCREPLAEVAAVLDSAGS